MSVPPYRDRSDHELESILREAQLLQHVAEINLGVLTRDYADRDLLDRCRRAEIVLADVLSSVEDGAQVNVDEIRACLSGKGPSVIIKICAERTGLLALVSELQAQAALPKGCPVHQGMIHGNEAEELRAGIEELIRHDLRVDAGALQRLLDRVDARDSLGHQELLSRTVAKHSQDLIKRWDAATAAHHGLDTNELVCFYEQEFYPLSNFSAFTLQWKGIRFDTSEAAYHWEKFPALLDPHDAMREAVRDVIRIAPSAHEAFGAARRNKRYCRPDWDDVKINVMRDILRAKVAQHPYVHKKLLETGTRRLVENSWRDDFWGWGASHNGKNMLGVLWMEVRAEIQGRDP